MCGPCSVRHPVFALDGRQTEQNAFWASWAACLAGFLDKPRVVVRGAEMERDGRGCRWVDQQKLELNRGPRVPPGSNVRGGIPMCPCIRAVVAAPG